MKQIFLFFIVAILSSAIGSATFYVIDKQFSKEKLIKEFYEIENAVHVSPHSVRKAIDSNDDSFILVDLRSTQEYANGHIKGAINIPAYKDPDTSAYKDEERIVNSFAKLKEKNPGKEIIVYCYSVPCMTGRKIGLMLAENGIYVQHLGIGWNEWRYSWTLWNHEHEWNLTKAEDYIESVPMSATDNNNSGCTVTEEFGC
ncbi:MAG TPA: rhodanese-like domain-containing protein [Nanoarchaeota archaeon]|nr:rhodanese-like domain-containing protein [Nanoarchaeota archaeon]